MKRRVKCNTPNKTTQLMSGYNWKSFTLGFLLIIGVAVLILLSGCSQNVDLEARYAKIETQRTEFADKLYQLPENPLRYKLRLMGEEFFFLAEMDTAADELKGYVSGPRYEASPLSALQDYSSIEEMHSTYLAGLIIEANSAVPEDVVIREPFEYPFTREFNWTSVMLSDGRNLDLQDTSITKPALSIKVGDNTGFRLQWDNETPVRATQLSGHIDFEIPQNPEALSFTQADRNKWRQLGDYRIRLIEIAEQHVSFEIQDENGEKPAIDDDDFLLGAKDYTGKYLQFLGGGTGTASETDVLILALNRAVDAALAGDIPIDISEDDLKLKLEELVSDQNKPTVATINVFFNGDVQAIDLVHLHGMGTSTNEIERDTVDFTSPDARDVPIRDVLTDAVVIDHSREHLLESIKQASAYDLTVGQLDKSIEVEAVRDVEGLIVIGFEYPSVPSDVFFQTSSRFGIWEEDYSFTAINQSGQDMEPSYTPERFFDGKLEIDRSAYEQQIYRAKGHITVSISPDMTVETLASDALPDGIQIDGNRVIADPKFIDQELMVFAIGQDGRVLKVIQEVLYPRPNLYQSATYYYGNPAALMMLRQGELQKIRYEFDVELDESINLPGAIMD